MTEVGIKRSRHGAVTLVHLDYQGRYADLYAEVRHGRIRTSEPVVGSHSPEQLAVLARLRAEAERLVAAAGEA